MARGGRRVGYAVLGAVLVGGLGVYAAGNGYLRGPAAAAEPDLVTLEAVCAWSGGALAAPTSLPLTSPMGDLAIPAGTASRYRVALTNLHRDGLALPTGSAPVLVATTVGDDSAVVGVAFSQDSPGARTLTLEEDLEFVGFSSFLACPGPGKEVSDGELLTAGTYDVHAGQALGRPIQSGAEPFNTWARLGTLRITPHPGARPDEVVPARAGECRSNLDDLPDGSNQHATFDEPDPVLVHVGAAFDPGVRMTNHGPLDLEDVIQGGPVLLVSDHENLVVARSESIDPLPGPGLVSGATMAFGKFAPLVDCASGEDLPPGRYQLTVAQQARDPESTRPIGTTTRYASLAITDDAAAERVQVRLPELPACGEPIDGFTFDPTYPAASEVRAGLYDWDDSSDGMVEDLAEGFPQIELAFTYDGPQRAMWPAARGIVLVRDGAVVARVGSMPYDPFEAVGWESDSARSAFLDTGSDCAVPETSFLEFEPSGRYTAAGFYAVTYDDEWGLTNRHVTVFGPVEVEFPEQ